MTALAPPPEALGAATQGLAEMPQSRPPNGPGFQGALEESLARTAIAEGHQGEEHGETSNLDRRDEARGRDGSASSSTSSIEAAASVGSASPTQPATDLPAQVSAGSARSENVAPGEGSAQVESSTPTRSRGAHGHGKPQLSSAAEGSTPHAQATVATTSTAPAASTLATGETAESVPMSTGTIHATALKGDARTPGSTQGRELDTVTPAGSDAGGQSASNDVAGSKSADPLASTADAADAAGPVASQSTGADVAPHLSATQTQASATQLSPPAATAPSSSSGSEPAKTPTTGAPTAEGSSASTATPDTVRLRLPWLDGSTQGTTAATGSLTTPRTSMQPTPGASKQAATGEAATATPAPSVSSTTTAVGHLANASRTSQAAAEAPQASASAPVPTASAPAGSAASAPSPSERTALYLPNNMQETIETIHATVALASRQGAAQAQISLEPAELGAVRIHLTQTSEGLTARVSAETVAGAQAIASGQSELHSTLSSLGISLLRLDVGAFAQQEARAGGQTPQQSRQSRQQADPGALAEDAEEPSTTTGTVSLSSKSALIDVLA
jgi:flagellar hook-length control protein FliK